MEITFASASLAALCNSERRLHQRWGPDLGRIVARRLLDLAAIDAAAIELLPGARVSSMENGETHIEFVGGLEVRGAITHSAAGSATRDGRGGRLLISSLNALGSEES